MSQARNEPPRRVAVLGGGVMGEAIVAAVLRAGVAVDDVAVSEPNAPRATEIAERYGVRAADGNAKVASTADVVIVAVKPKDIGDVLAEISPRLRQGTIVASVAAGLPIAFYEQRRRAADGRGRELERLGARQPEQHPGLRESVDEVVHVRRS